MGVSFTLKYDCNIPYAEIDPRMFRVAQKEWIPPAVRAPPSFAALEGRKGHTEKAYGDTQEKPFKCDEPGCNKTFLNKSQF